MDSAPPPDDRTRWAELFEAHAPALQRRLAARFEHVDSELVVNAAVDATRWLAEHFSRFDPERGDLFTFLFGIARRILLRLLRGEQRRRHREQKNTENVVTDSSAAGKSLLDELADRERLEQRLQELAPTENERRELTLHLHDEDDPKVWAEVLGLRDSTDEEQRKGMDRARSRWRQRLCRDRKRGPRKDGS